MFSFMIVVNDNGELKSVSAAELGARYGNEQDLLVDQIESVLSSILRDRASAGTNQWDDIVEHSFDETVGSD